MLEKVQTWARRLGATGTAALVAVAVTGAPAHAAGNPYTAASACSNEFGGSWSSVTDGHRGVINAQGRSVGDVYLMYNNATGYNCVVTLKSSWVGTKTYTEANLWVSDGGMYTDEGLYSYYAATKGPAKGKCVSYGGKIYAPDGITWASGDRYQMGNCG
ncbi:hypothetical protein [Dactylosporangium sp. NPDC048998]|uniref:hypothetical protein n=1 Tax=Dactylosporangium sp. NPDC048998 TaxID=3363976 RepID=UPI00371DF984